MNQKCPFYPTLIQSENERKTLLGGVQKKENTDPKKIIIIIAHFGSKFSFTRPKLVDVVCFKH